MVKIHREQVFEPFSRTFNFYRTVTYLMILRYLTI